MNRNWYCIENNQDDTADLLIYEQIGTGFFDDGVNAKDLVNEIKNLDVSKINVSINSPGGNVFDGNAIYNALRAHKAEVEITIDGLAASIASVIAMAGTVIMPENAMLMIHDPSGYAAGNAKDMEKMAGLLAKIKKGILAAYQNKTGLEETELSDLMAQETWFTAQEALEKGFADSVIGKVQIQASFHDRLSRFKNVPEFFYNQLETKPIAQEGIDMPEKKTVNAKSLASDYPDVIAEIKNAAYEDGVAAGKEGEQARIKAVASQSLAGHEDLINTMIMDGKTTGAEAATAIIKAERDAKALIMDQHDADAPEPVLAASAVEKQPLSFEAQMKSDWEKNADIRAEFDNDFDVYVAAEIAINQKLARVITGREG